MKILLKLGGSLLALALLLVAIAWVLPRRYHVQRSVHIQATAETVYTYVGDLRRWREWGVWFERDPQMKITYSEKTDVVDGWSAWEILHQKGKMTLIALQPPFSVRYRLEFPDTDTTSIGVVEIVPDAGGVNVTFSDDGDLGLNPVSRWFGLFVDRMIGPDFDAGLSKLRQVSEKGS